MFWRRRACGCGFAICVLDRVLIVSEQHLRAILTEYQAYHNTARPHQGIVQRAPDDEVDAARTAVTDVDSRRIRQKLSLPA